MTTKATDKESIDGLRKSGINGLRILHVTPELASLPEVLDCSEPRIVAKSGGLADVTASLADGLHSMGVDLHLALPHYRRLFGVDPDRFDSRRWKDYKQKSKLARVHLAEDRSFYYRERIYDEGGHENPNVALAFQREVINHILPKVDPDIVHCHDWMTGLVPAAAKRLGIPCVFTIHNIHTERIILAHMEQCGIDMAEFWESLFFERYPSSYEASRDHNRVDLLASGILASDIVTTVSPTFLEELIRGEHGEFTESLRAHLTDMRADDRALGILNAPHDFYDPSTDPALAGNFDARTAIAGKAVNKAEFQRRIGLTVDPNAPMYFWPSRLDPVQKGCQLLAEILWQIIETYSDRNLQVAFVADGPYQRHFHDIVAMHGLQERVAVMNFNEDLSRLGYAASDFTLVPSRFEPCGLAQMVALRYGSLPLAHRTGGLRDTVRHLDGGEHGNGFLFENYDSNAFRWAIDQSMKFFSKDQSEKSIVVSRVMLQSVETMSSSRMICDYVSVYKAALARREE